MSTLHRMWPVALAGVVAAAVLAQPADAGRKAPKQRDTKPAAIAPSATSLRELASAFESARLLAGADRMAALERLDAPAADLARHGDGDDTRRGAAFLAAALQAEMAKPGAESAWGEAASSAGGTPFEDDAEFAQ